MKAAAAMPWPYWIMKDKFILTLTILETAKLMVNY